MEKTKT